MPEPVETMVAEILRLVRCESPSDDLAAVARSADAVAELGTTHLGAAPERIVIDGRTHLRWRFPGGPRILVLGHHDTVWPVGSLEELPACADDETLAGPGCFDMKAGLVIAFHALAQLTDLAGITVLVTGDEEPGSTTSRALIEDEARASVAALVLEAAGPEGALKIARKGVSRYEIAVHGRASHAGLDPEQGVNATLELAHQVQAVALLGDAEAGTTVTPTRTTSGTTTNTVPAQASFSVDVRALSAAEQERVHAGMLALTPRIHGARVVVDGGINRSPLAADSSAELFRRAQRVADRLALPPLTGISVGGASDGNFTAGVGTPTLDGLGAVGAGAHAAHEHVLIAELEPRTRLLAGLIEDIRSAPFDRPDPTASAKTASASITASA
ncbi:M20/M25/M40 family metallo-hydrolase [Microbacterium azadirachtae]|uniref:Carboxypeptidase G2 n=1 Tax=Microbacterium azadirachtae TaxID=582680 RepID=A0A0F0LLT8_9MICO|nr:M20/M25/M40 family metallo-hydrolase [Microbacterium azadirachtae]KJL33215.1 Carboxypeptidase G2 precursor [Microbacterium azadirachtae]